MKGIVIMKKQAFNPYLPSYEYVPDGEPRIFDGRLYIYGSHDRFNGKEYCENDYVCWSAAVDDLSDWRYEGVIFKKEWHGGDGEGMLYAPDVIKGGDGNYYLYYSIAHSSVISVARCDKPAGEYQYYGDVKDLLGNISGSKAGEYVHFDPSVFIDDDGKIYLYSGFKGKNEVDSKGRIFAGAHVCELCDDMITLKEKPKLIFDDNTVCPLDARFFEASSVRKINGIYYFVYSARITGLHYCTSNYPDREFVYRGRIHSSSDVGINGYTAENPAYPVGNTHGGMVCVNGQYYIFDHRFSNNTSFCRQGVAEPVYIDKNGFIQQAEATSCGLNGGPLNGRGLYPAYIACCLIDRTVYGTEEEKKKNAPFLTQEGEDRECEPGQFLTAFHDGCTVGYKYFKPDGAVSVSVTLRGNAAGMLKLSLHENNAVISRKKIEVNSLKWEKVTLSFKAQNEVHPLYFSYEGIGSLDILSFELI